MPVLWNTIQTATVWWLCLLWMYVGVTMAQQANCNDDDDSPSVAVVAVASVFGTLAVVALLLIVAFFIIRRRNGGVVFASKPSNKHKASPEEGSSGYDPQRECYDNPVFSIQDGGDTEQGKGKFSSKKFSFLKKSLKKDNSKTWVSLPGHEDFPDVPHRQGSCGSLDTSLGPETASVCLKSQDIIGLGFKITGNMRDGIYVSQVHSRGPAAESGKISVGDRIMSVTIAYENIVYEDALTILSYASPYPVQVTLQKERVAHANAQPTPGLPADLRHPLYRSQSMDAVQLVGKDPSLKAKRTPSEARAHWNSLGNGRTERASRPLSQSYHGYSSHVEDVPGFDVNSDVMVHSADHVADETIHLNDLQERLTATTNGITECSPVMAKGEEDLAEASAGRKKSRLDTEAAREFVHLMDQVQDGAGRKGGDKEGRISASPKTAPSKPERKKKPSNASNVSSEESTAALEDLVGPDEAFHSSTTAELAQTCPKNTNSQSTESQEKDIQTSCGQSKVMVDNQAIQVEGQISAEKSQSTDGFVSIDLSDDQRPLSPQTEQRMKVSLSSIDTQTEPLPNGTKGRNKSKDREEAKEKKPAFDEAELERLIAMNAFPPGTQGLAGIQAGGKEGGVHDDFVPRDLAQQALNSHFQVTRSRKNSCSSEASSQGPYRQRAGVAFEVRDDAMTGRPMSVDLSRSRNSSASPSRSSSCERILRSSSLVESQQAVSQKRQGAEDKENREDRSDWSSKHMPPAASLPDLAQDDTVSDWTDRNKGNDIEDNTSSAKRSAIDNPESEDVETEGGRAVTPRDVFKARENLATMSDLSNSISSSRSSSPAVINGPADGLSVVSAKNTPKELPSASDSGANSKTMTVSARSEEDMDC